MFLKAKRIKFAFARLLALKYIPAYLCEALASKKRHILHNNICTNAKHFCTENFITLTVFPMKRSFVSSFLSKSTNECLFTQNSLNFCQKIMRCSDCDRPIKALVFISIQMTDSVHISQRESQQENISTYFSYA